MTNIDLIVYDFDGVMTNNMVYLDQHGQEMIKANRADGLGVAEISKIGIDQIIISSETNAVVTARAKKLGLVCLQGITDKKDILINYCTRNHIDLSKVAFVGNDINDMNAMKVVGTSICPADANHKIKNISDIILKTKGGDGVIRELLDYLIGKNK